VREKPRRLTTTKMEMVEDKKKITVLKGVIKWSYDGISNGR